MTNDNRVFQTRKCSNLYEIKRNKFYFQELGIALQLGKISFNFKVSSVRSDIPNKQMCPGSFKHKYSVSFENFPIMAQNLGYILDGMNWAVDKGQFTGINRILEYFL